MKKLTQQLQFNIAGSKLSSATNTGFGVTWVPKTCLIGKKTEKSILANPLEIADNSKNVSLKIMSRGLFGIGLFCTFPHQKNIFQGSKVVSEAIFSTKKWFLAPEVPDMRMRKRQKRALSQKAFCSRF